MSYKLYYISLDLVYRIITIAFIYQFYLNNKRKKLIDKLITLITSIY